MAGKKQKAKKQKARKQPAKKQPAKKRPPKKKPHKKPTKLFTCDTSPDICVTNFTAGNGDKVCFQNIPTAGVTITRFREQLFPLCQRARILRGLSTRLSQPGDTPPFRCRR